MLSELNEFIQSNPDARESKRAVAVEMFFAGTSTERFKAF